jgi:hypothetical protein
VYLVVSLVDDDPADALGLAEAERDPKLELGDSQRSVVAEKERTAARLRVRRRSAASQLSSP